MAHFHQFIETKASYSIEVCPNAAAAGCAHTADEQAALHRSWTWGKELPETGTGVLGGKRKLTVAEYLDSIKREVKLLWENEEAKAVAAAPKATALQGVSL